MEDYPLVFAHSKIGTFFGIFDGHSGKKTAEYVADVFVDKFVKQFQEKGLSLQERFKETFLSIQKDLEKFKWKCGTCALVGWIPPGTRHLIVATLGDSQAKLYRGDQVMSLSKVERWSDQTAMDRAKEAASDVWGRFNQRLGYPGKGYNLRGGLLWRNKGSIFVSRTLGDIKQRRFGWKYGEEKIREHKRQAISLVPFVQHIQLQKGDKIIFGCDGLWDECRDHMGAIQKVILAGREVAKTLAESAVNKWGSKDNVSVIAFQVT